MPSFSTPFNIIYVAVGNLFFILFVTFIFLACHFAPKYVPFCSTWTLNQMEPRKDQNILRKSKLFHLFLYLRKRLCKIYRRIRFVICSRPRPRLVIRRLGHFCSRRRRRFKRASCVRSTRIHLNGSSSTPARSIRIATFNAALFAMAPAAPNPEFSCSYAPTNAHPKSILKHSPSHKRTKSKLRVSIDLPDNEISLARDTLLTSPAHDDDAEDVLLCTDVPVRSPLCFAVGGSSSCSRTVMDVLREVDADIVALQDVKADEEKGMEPLAEVADGLGMKYVFAESWAPEYGNAILSRWPIKSWKVHKILNDADIRNVLKATVEVPWMGEVNIYCTQLDYLDENWRMKQINAIIQCSEAPHILAGGLNSLQRSDYSLERWTDIVKYFEEIGKPKPKDEVMKLLKDRGYKDAKDYAGECHPVVMIAKGQNVQGTCKYGTRVDYILSSPDFPYKFVPGSYSVMSSKGTSDHHVVKVDITKGDERVHANRVLDRWRTKQAIRIGDPCSLRSTWNMDR